MSGIAESCIDLRCGVEHLSPVGDLLHSDEFDSKSFVRNFIAWWYSYFAYDSGNTGTNVSGVSVPLVPAYYRNSGRNMGGTDGLYFVAGAGDASCGIVVGSGSEEPSANDYALNSKITHGTSTGELMYGMVVDVNPASTPMLAKYSRSFVNEGVASVPVREVGIIASTVQYYYNGSVELSAQRVLIVRDVLDPVVVMNPGDIVNFYYTINME